MPMYQITSDESVKQLKSGSFITERALQKLVEKNIEKASKNYIAYKHGKNFCEVWIQASKLKIWLDIAPADLVDPLHLTRDVTKVGHWGTGDVEATLETPFQLDAIMALVEQAYQQTV